MSQVLSKHPCSPSLFSESKARSSAPDSEFINTPPNSIGSPIHIAHTARVVINTLVSRPQTSTDDLRAPQ